MKNVGGVCVQKNILCAGITLGIVFGIVIDAWYQSGTQPIVYTAEAHEEVEEVKEKVILIEVKIDWTPERIEKKIRETFPENPSLAVAIAKAESGPDLKPEAYNPEWHNGCQGSYGVFQIACVHGSKSEDLYNPAYNIKRARELYDEQGWQPWGGYTSGGYEKFL